MKKSVVFGTAIVGGSTYGGAVTAEDVWGDSTATFPGCPPWVREMPDENGDEDA